MNSVASRSMDDVNRSVPPMVVASRVSGRDPVQRSRPATWAPHHAIGKASSPAAAPIAMASHRNCTPRRDRPAPSAS